MCPPMTCKDHQKKTIPFTGIHPYKKGENKNLNTKELPTKNNLIKIKRSIKQSKEGQMLLEQKRIILTKELEMYIDESKKMREKGKILLQEAYHTLSLANMEIGLDDMIDIADGIKVDNSIDIKYKSIMGVEIPSVVFEMPDLEINYGLYNTTAAVDEAMLKFREVKAYLIELAQVENIIFRLKKDIEKVQRRSNALKEIIIPQDESLAKKIQEILDENEKEEFIRLKNLKKKR